MISALIKEVKEFVFVIMIKDLKESSCSPREDHGMGQIPTGSLLK